MKKRILAAVFALMLVLSSITVAAKNGVELPMIPIESNPLVAEADVRLSSGSSSTVYYDDDILFTTEVSNFGSKGLSKAVFTYTYSAGLEFNGDIKVDNLSSGWQVTDTINSANKLSFTVGDNSGSSALVDTSLSLSFSFGVTALSGNDLSLKLSSVSLYDKNGGAVKYRTIEVNNKFSTEAAIPEMKNLGAALRINNTPAIAFGMSVTKDAAFMSAFPSGKYVYSQDSDLKFGIIVIERDKLTSDLNVSTDGAEVIYFTELSDIDSNSNANELVFSYVIDSITDYTKEYTFRPFVAFREASSGSYSYYYEAAKNRSAEYIAKAELKNEFTPEKVELLNKFVK